MFPHLLLDFFEKGKIIRLMASQRLLFLFCHYQMNVVFGIFRRILCVGIDLVYFFCFLTLYICFPQFRKRFHQTCITDSFACSAWTSFSLKQKYLSSPNNNQFSIKRIVNVFSSLCLFSRLTHAFDQLFQVGDKLCLENKRLYSF